MELEPSFIEWTRQQVAPLPERAWIAVLSLAADGATVPFMARYRKEQTGNLDEVQIQTILDLKEKWDQLQSRKQTILEKIAEQKLLSEELKAKILSTQDLTVLEDLYLPYKQKKKTKATLAKEAGLGPLADWIWNCGHGLEVPQPGQTLELWAFTFRQENYPDVPSVLQGAQDILVERLSERQDLRQEVRSRLFSQGVIVTRPGKKVQTPSKFEPYFAYQERLSQLLQPEYSHRYLAIRRGWMEEELQLSIQGPPTLSPATAAEEGSEPSDPEFQAALLQLFEQAAFCAKTAFPDTPSGFSGIPLLKKAAHLALKAYVLPSIETEVHKALREQADQTAIHVFSENLKKLLLASPLGSQTVLGVDPGIRTGCKLALIDPTGKYIASTVLHLHTEEGKQKARETLPDILRTAQVQAIAVGNGTGGREAEVFLRKLLKEQGFVIPVILVSESGASVYSASEVARQEFPDLDLTIRGAISIARRLQDPLAELVKVDPKSIGVGQYQHDVSQPALKRSLEHTVESCVNQVGVNLNTASSHLLAYVSGIGASLAQYIIQHRETRGLFRSREELLQVPRFTQKVFEQAAGFLRIPNGINPLDNTAVHPEKYSLLEAFCASHHQKLEDLLGKQGAQLLKKAATFQEEIGPYTFQDLLEELEKPGRDPRPPFEAVFFREDVFELKDLKVGLICPGIVTNVTNFGAFIDIGVHQDGLVHLSQIRDDFVKDPKQVLFPGDKVQVKVLGVDFAKKQISLSIKEALRNTPQGFSGSQKQGHSSSVGKTSPHKASSPHKRGGQASGKPAVPPPFHNPFSSLNALKSQLKKR